LLKCRAADDPKSSVVDKFQRSHDHKNLYLVGSSTFPLSGSGRILTLSKKSMGVDWADRKGGPVTVPTR